MTRLKTLVSVALPVGTTVASTLLLHRISTQEWLPLPPEVLDVPPEQAIYGVVWMLAIAVTAWIALTTLLSLVAYSTRIAVAIRAVEWMALPPVRRLGRRWAGLLLAVGSVTVALPAGATVAPPIPVVVGTDQPVAAIPDSAVASAYPNREGAVSAVPMKIAGDKTESTVPEDRAAINAPPFLPRQSGQHGTDGPVDTVVHRVRPGDDLWSITAAHVAREGDGAPSPAQIVALWRQVIALNQERLRSADPDLIFPGEKILLPPLPARLGD